jgi:GTP-binding protein
MTKRTLPKVVIVGRTNVGKSTLFNRLSVDVKSLTLDQEGVTRDVIKDIVSWQGTSFELIDTGGISLKKTQDPILQEARKRALDILENASLILFVCDGKAGMVAEDRDLAKMLHKIGKKVVLVVNKIDVSDVEEQLHEFNQLGFHHTLSISAQHGKGIADLLETIVNEIEGKSGEQEDIEPEYRVVLLGKPNVGKSSLMNLLLKQERSIVADVAGTTREPISEHVHFYKAAIQFTDTPGVRKKRSVTDQLEGMMVKSALGALKDADIVLLLVDATAGRVSDQELKLIFYAFQDQHKALVVLFNKQDITDEYAQETMNFNLESYEYLMKKIERLDISCKTGKNVGRIIPLVEKIWERHSQRFSDDELTVLFKEALMSKPLFRKTQPLMLYGVKQVKTAPITLAIRVNQPSWFGSSQLAFFEGVMRRTYNLKGVPIRFLVRKRRK